MRITPERTYAELHVASALRAAALQRIVLRDSRHLGCDGSTDHRRRVSFLHFFHVAQLEHVDLYSLQPVVSFLSSYVSKLEQANLHNSRSAQKPSRSASLRVARL